MSELNSTDDAGQSGKGGNNEPPDVEIKPVETDPSKRYIRYPTILGRGAFKTVYKAFDEVEGIEVAWNQVQVNDLVSSPQERERLFAEIRVLKQLKHKNIMTFYDSWLDQKNLTVNFITELFTSGTLRQYRKRHKHIDEQVLKRWSWQILQGLVYLHGHNPPIIHRDLKCDNIFVNGSSGVVKIGDLGLATLWRGLTAPQSVLGTPEFMAPELYEEKYNEKVDVYSFGMCMLELATMEYPYSECKNAAQIYKKVTQGVLPEGLEKVKNEELREFIRLCIGHDPNQRPEARQLLKHVFFNSIRNGKLSCPGVVVRDRSVEDGSRSPTVSDGSEASEEGEHGSRTPPDEYDRDFEMNSSLERTNPKPDQALAAKPPAAAEPAAPGDRGFVVNCNQVEDTKLSFQLRFTEPEGHCKTVEFAFDLKEDTADAIASEMMEDLSLSKEEAEFIAQNIKNEIGRWSRAAARPQPPLPVADMLPPPTFSNFGPPQEAPLAEGQPVAARLASREDTETNGLQRTASSSTQQNRSDVCSPNSEGTVRAPSIHDIIRAFHECYEQEKAQPRDTEVPKLVTQGYQPANGIAHNGST